MSDIEYIPDHVANLRNMLTVPDFVADPHLRDAILGTLDTLASASRYLHYLTEQHSANFQRYHKRCEEDRNRLEVQRDHARVWARWHASGRDGTPEGPQIADDGWDGADPPIIWLSKNGPAIVMMEDIS